jgi:ABC-type phosphate/phosphonate transport system substrate-binding protein
MRIRSLSIRLTVALAAATSVAPAAADDVTCWFPPDLPAASARQIADALSAAARVHPRLAHSYPELIAALGSRGNDVAYVDAFAQAIVSARRAGVPLAQASDGAGRCGAWMIHPRGADPVAILARWPAEIAFARGAGAGELGAKAATDGKAGIATSSHDAAAAAVESGKARAAFVKSSWWEAHRAQHPGLAAYQVPGVSDAGTPDHVLTAGAGVDPAVRARLKAAALASPAAFGAKAMAEFDGDLSSTLGLMRRGKIDPASYPLE